MVTCVGRSLGLMAPTFIGKPEAGGAAFEPPPVAWPVCILGWHTGEDLNRPPQSGY